MIEYLFGRYYHVHQNSKLPEDYTQKWDKFNKTYKEESLLRESQQGSLVVMIREVGQSLWKAKIFQLLQVWKKVKSLITKG